MPSSQFREAVVVGASMAGLLATRVLADRLDRVTLIERDELPRRAESRKGVPQGRHVHVLLPRGHAIIEGLFPGLTEELRGAGAHVLNGGRDVAWFHATGWRKRYDSELWLLALTRPLLENRIAERVRALGNVEIVENSRVQSVRCEGRAITAVLVGARTGPAALEADLVVDATGRGSAMPRWLEVLGYGPVATDTIPVPVTYSSCLFPLDGNGRDWQALVVASPAEKRTGFTFVVEGDRLLVTLASLLDEPFPEDHQEFIAFAKSLPVPDLHETIRGLEPLSDLVRFRFAGSQRRRYERLKSLPNCLIAIGDSVSSFNPVYGQGMTVAALEAEFLGRALDDAQAADGLAGTFAQRWFRGIGRIVDSAWKGVAIEDFRLPELAHRAPISLRPLQWYMQRMHEATCRSKAVTDQFYRVIAFLDAPSALFRPAIMADILFRTGGKRAEPRP